MADKRRRRIMVSKKRMLKQVMKYHKKNGIPYKIKFTNNHIYLWSRRGYFMTEDHAFPMRELVYIKQFRNHVIENKLYSKIPKGYKKYIQFFSYSPELQTGMEFKNLYEIDLKSAYWGMCKKLGIVPESLDLKTIDINPKTGKIFMSKTTRLAAVGSLAKKEEIEWFDGKKISKRRTIHSTQTRHVWDYVCYRISQVMAEASKVSGSSFMFFWVDAIVVDTEASFKRVQKVFKKHGFDYSVIRIKKLVIKKKKLVVYDYKDNDRPFHLIKPDRGERQKIKK